MTPLAVSLAGACDLTRQRHAAVLATLPALLRVADGPGADVVVVSGLRADWPAAAAAALEGGARGVLVARPSHGEPPAVRALEDARRAAGAVVVTDAVTADPAWRAALPRLRGALPGALLLDSLAVGADGAGLFDQLGLLRDLIGGLAAEPAGRADSAGHRLTGAHGATAVTLAGTRSAAVPAFVRLLLVAPAEQWRIVFDASHAAAPTRVARFGPGGGELAPDAYERPERAAWRRLAAVLGGGEPPEPSPLPGLAADLELVRRLRA